jgi:1-deoxy-D-xylulose-5-phosphate reductoisomerase
MLAHLSQPDMRIPIAAALYFPARPALPWKRLDLGEAGKLEFVPPDLERFPALNLARSAQAAGGGKPAVLNAANEVAVKAFLSGRIRFPEIVSVTEQVLDSFAAMPGPLTVEKVLAVDAGARERATEVIDVMSTAKGAQD